MRESPVAIVGLGLMGEVYARRLIDARIPVIGFDIDAARQARLAEIGGRAVGSIAELAGPSRCVIIAVFNTDQVEDVIENHLLPALGKGSGKIVLCMSTCDPDQVAALAARVIPRGIRYLDVPVSGTSDQVRRGDGVALIGGDTKIAEEVREVFDALFARSFQVGKIGDGGRAKLAVNLILGLNRLALAEGLVFAERLGLDPAAFLAVARGSASYSQVMETKGPKMLSGDFSPEGRAKQTLKDVHLMLDQAANVGQKLAMLEVHAEVLEACVRAGEADLDNSVVIKEVRRRGAKPRACSGVGRTVMKKILLAFAAALIVSAGLARPAFAQDFPQRPIHFIIAFGPGGGSDIIGRILADSMQSKLGQPVIVENKPGAGGILGNDVVAKATPDGYTLGVMTAGQIIAAVTKKNMPYDTNAAFAPVGQIATASLMIVTRPDFPANNVKELVAYAKAHPGKVVFASPGFGATQHFAGEMFKQIAGVDLLHVPYKTSPEAINAVLGKHADILFDTVSALIGQVKSGQLKALAVTGKDRFPAVSDVPPAADSGVLPGFDVTTWYGLFAPRGTPPAVIAKLNKALNESLADDAVKTRMSTVGVVVKSSTPDAFGQFLASEYQRWNAVRETAGIPQQ